MSGLDAPALLGFAAGIIGTVAAFGAKYAFDFRLAKRRLELDERGAIATVLGGRPGQLRRASIRLRDRVDGIFRDMPRMSSWLRQGRSPSADGYFLRSSTHRVFAYLSWATLMQQALDSLPAETLRARTDLQRQYALLEVTCRILTGIDMFNDLPGYQKDREGYHLFTGTVDELADLGVAAFNSNAQVIPASVFEDAYTQGQPTVLRLRNWLSYMSVEDDRANVIKARFACLGAVLEELIAPSNGGFAGRSTLTHRLAEIALPGGSDVAAVLPSWLDAQLSGAQQRWHSL
jgi:hypothetical protein